MHSIQDKSLQGQSPYGSAASRLAASMIDTAALYFSMLGGAFLGGFLAALMASPQATRRAAENAAASGMFLGLLFWGCAFWFLNFGIFQGMTGKTMGKHLMGIKVVNLDGTSIGVFQSLMRSACYWVSSVPFCVGFIAQFWNKNSQCWHDAICGTVVIKKDAIYPVSVAQAPLLLPELPQSRAA